MTDATRCQATHPETGEQCALDAHGKDRDHWDGVVSTWADLECLDRHQGDCTGPVEYRFPLSATGKSFPRCDGHWAERLRIQEGINRRYPEQQPSDFDPTFAGERWDEDY